MAEKILYNILKETNGRWNGEISKSLNVDPSRRLNKQPQKKQYCVIIAQL